MAIPLRRILHKRRLELKGLALSLLACCLVWPQVLHFSHRNDANREVSEAPPLWRTLEGLEYRLYDARFTARGIVHPPSRDKIAIIGIDQMTQDVLGDWPFPREWHAQVIRRLNKAGARVIFFDFDFSARQNIKSDAAFAAAVAEAKNVLLPSHLAAESKAVGTHTAALTDRLAAPLGQNAYDEVFLNRDGSIRADKTPEEVRAYRTFAGLGLDEGTADLCLLNIPRDSDNAVRRYPLRTTLLAGDENVGSVAALSAGLYQKLLDGEENPRYERALATAAWPTVSGTPVPIPLLPSQRPPGDAPHPVTTPIHFWGPPGTFKTYSYMDVRGFSTVSHLNRDGTPDRQGHAERHGFTDSQLKDKFGGRIVFIGATALILGDLFSMPQITTQRPSGEESQLPGVEIHATATAMLLDGVYLRAVTTKSTIITLFALSFTASLWTVMLRGWVSRVARTAQYRWAHWHVPGRVHSVVWITLYCVLAALPAVLFWEAAKWLFSQHNLWVIVIYPALGATLSTGLVLILLYSTETAERRKTVAQFGRFMSPSILEEVLARPEEDYPRPREAYATVLFTDLEGFTSYTETHPPEAVGKALNAYMTRMIPIIQNHGGTFDKYIGDAIMAFFGVPVASEDHARCALLCAVALQEECARFRRDTGIEFYMRVGVHTGVVIAGSMGSEGTAGSQPLLNYTVLGDTVNLASRLEGKNKEFGSWIMCSAVTYEAAPDVVCVESASTQIKGKSQVVDVYVVRGLTGQPPCDHGWGRSVEQES